MFIFILVEFPDQNSDKNWVVGSIDMVMQILNSKINFFVALHTTVQAIAMYLLESTYYSF